MKENNIWREFRNYVSLLFIIKIYNFLVVDKIFFSLDIGSNLSNFQNISIIGFISAIFIAPIIEETIFRTHLSFNKKHFFGVFLMLLTFAIFFSLTGGWIYAIIVISIGTLFLVFHNKFRYLIQERYHNGTYIFTSILFCIINYSYLKGYNFSVIVKIGLLLLHYLPLSLYLGVISKKFGLVSSMGAHSVNNFLSIIGNSLYYS